MGVEGDEWAEEVVADDLVGAILEGHPAGAGGSGGDQPVEMRDWGGMTGEASELKADPLAGVGGGGVGGRR
ncbi:MAG: hypothetical protein ACKOJF_07465, partial [Planctomycetaceae bacterium]